jgi:hypothetical protein
MFPTILIYLKVIHKPDLVFMTLFLRVRVKGEVSPSPILKILLMKATILLKNSRRKNEMIKQIYFLRQRIV